MATAKADASADDSFAARFNACTTPKEALKLVNQLELSVDDVCSRLHAASLSIDTTLLGECLGHHHDFWQQCAARFACHFDEFSGLSVSTALRRYLWRFRLPGEAGPIGRILEGFAHGYFEANKPPVAAVARKHAPCSHAQGYFVRQPLGPNGKPCCISCGALERSDECLTTCTGCGVVVFCQRCAKHAGKWGHAIRGCIGYGRAWCGCKDLTSLVRAVATTGVRVSLTTVSPQHASMGGCRTDASLMQARLFAAASRANTWGAWIAGTGSPRRAP